MFYNYDYLKDTSFLEYLHSQKILTYFIKITFLNWKEKPIKSIEEKILNFSLTVDGKSSLRRTGTASFILQDETLQDLFFINKKISIEVGYYNTTSQYREYQILWFPQGLFIITDYSISHNLQGVTVSLSFKDKMCLLNGQCGGTFSASVVFDNYDTLDQDNNIINIKPSMYQIIRQLVNHFGQQQLSKIIISDLDTTVKQAVKWLGSSPLYFLEKNNQYFMTINDEQYTAYLNNGWRDIEGSPFSYGNNVGFINTDFTYPEDLIAEAGSSITDILDKIKNVLGNYEYFYDINGNFIFQEIKNFLNNTQTKYILESMNNNQLLPDYLATMRQSYILERSDGKNIWDFTTDKNKQLIISYSNSPKISLIKNDYVVWGIKKTSTGTQIPIRYHLAIDRKPQIGNTYYGFQYEDPEDGLLKWAIPLRFNRINDFPTIGLIGVFYYSALDNNIYKWDGNQYISLEITLQRITTTDWRTELYFQGLAAQPYGIESNYYFTELKNEWPKIYNIVPDVYQNNKWVNHSSIKENFIRNPNDLQYFLDFIDSSEKISKYNIDNIGRRTKVLNEGKNLNCVFEAWIPDIILLQTAKAGHQAQMEALKEKYRQQGQQYYQVSDAIYSNLSVGGDQYSCYESIRQLLQDYTNYNDNVSINLVPLYFLQPNTSIRLHDEKSQIDGNYLISSFSLSLSATDSSMSINATKVLEKM